jgi:hypothetical protein
VRVSEEGANLPDVIDRDLDRGHFAKTTEATTTRPENLLGYAPERDSQTTNRKVGKGELVFETTETIGHDGLRVAPLCESAKSSIVFFGGSFTFGTGVNDDEAMPYVTAVRLHCDYQIYNFAYGGYGPHQMLAALEGGLVEEVVEESPRFGIYQAIPSHIDRSAGLSSWDQNGPRYLVNEDGRVERRGRFSDGMLFPARRLVFRLRRSFLVDRVLSRFGRGRIGYRGVELFGAIVGRARDIFESSYPESAFHVIFWDDRHVQRDAIIEELRRRKISTHLVGEIIPEFTSAPQPYQISEFDHHPSALAHTIIASYITSQIVGRE